MTIKTFRHSAARVVRAALSVGAVALAVLIAQSIALTPEAQAQTKTCPAWMLNVAGVCKFCPGNQIVKDGACAVAGSPQELCTGKGWIFSRSSGGQQACEIKHAPGINGITQLRCALHPQNNCVGPFGLNHFPNRPEDGSKPVYAYNCDVDGTSGLIPARANTISATECLCPDGQGLDGDGMCAACPTSFTSMIFNRRCVPEDEENVGTASEKVLCGAFGGAVEDATGGGKVCSGMDANDTFCVIDSTEGFPCRGLLKHLYICNVQHNRKALNPFFCGAKCGERQAVGSDCIQIRRGGD